MTVVTHSEQGETPSVVRFANNIVNSIFKLTSYFLVVLLALMSITIVYQVFSRYILGSPSSISEEILRY